MMRGLLWGLGTSSLLWGACGGSKDECDASHCVQVDAERPLLHKECKGNGPNMCPDGLRCVADNGDDICGTADVTCHCVVVECDGDPCADLQLCGGTAGRPSCVDWWKHSCTGNADCPQLCDDGVCTAPNQITDTVCLKGQCVPRAAVCE